MIALSVTNKAVSLRSMILFSTGCPRICAAGFSRTTIVAGEGSRNSRDCESGHSLASMFALVSAAPLGGGGKVVYPRIDMTTQPAVRLRA